MKIFAFRRGDRRRLGVMDGAQPRDLSAALEAAGVVEGEHELLRHDFFRPQRLVAFLKRWRRFAPKIDGEIAFEAPVLPGKILAVGRNFAEHASELGNAVETPFARSAPISCRSTTSPIPTNSRSSPE
jgi:2-keto-4-pentenoate hydratase/2-oxohepta-3-ene-1,7-dioic acid hydratase in catechol pathway